MTHWLDPGNMTAKRDRMRNDADVTPCPNPECWCQVDKVDPSKPVHPTGADVTITAADKPMTVSWDRSGYVKITDEPLGGFDWDTTPHNAWYDGETRERDPETGGEKGKKLAELGAIDPASLMELAEVAGYGSHKYARLNYMKGYKWSLSFDAMQRHLLAFWNGESLDPESGLHHLAHAAWHCMTLMSYDERNLGTDDRYHE